MATQKAFIHCNPARVSPTLAHANLLESEHYCQVYKVHTESWPANHNQLPGKERQAIQYTIT